MSGPGEAIQPEPPASAPAASADAADAASFAQSPTHGDCGSDDRAEGRDALRALAAMIGVEVFY